MSLERKLASVVDETAAAAGIPQARVSMVLTDPRAHDNPIVYVNATFEETTGYNRSAVIGRNCRFLQGEDTTKAHVDTIREAIEQGKDVAVDILNYRSNGEPFTNRLIIAPITDEAGRVIYFLAIQKELNDLDQEREGIDSLLTTLRGRVTEDLSMLLMTIGLPDDTEAFAHAAMTRRMEALQLVYESMKLSDEQDGMPGHHDGGIDLGSLLSRVCAAIAHEEGRPGIRYMQQIEAMNVTLESSVRLALLVSEVLSNAFAHAFDRMDEGFVEMRLSHLAAGGLRIAVTDDGVGLPSNAPFPNPETTGGRLMETLIKGLDATMTPVRGAAGTVIMVDVPAGIVDF